MQRPDFTRWRSVRILQIFTGRNWIWYAKSAVLTDADTGRILYGKMPAIRRWQMPALRRSWTCLLAIESGKYRDTVTFSEHACSMPKVRLGCSRTGTQFVLEDLLVFPDAGIHNDTSSCRIAEHVAGSVEAFCRCR
ncbi:MAG: hypothetical protein ACLUD0_10955 [Eubacterium ramulus]